MKLINYNYGSVLPKSSTHYRGKIVMTEAEWKEALKYLKSKKVSNSFMPSYPWVNSLFLEDIARAVETKTGRIFTVRTSMTEKLAEKYQLPRYKRQNYFIEIV